MPPDIIAAVQGAVDKGLRLSAAADVLRDAAADLHDTVAKRLTAIADLLPSSPDPLAMVKNNANLVHQVFAHGTATGDFGAAGVTLNDVVFAHNALIEAALILEDGA